MRNLFLLILVSLCIAGCTEYFSVTVGSIVGPASMANSTIVGEDEIAANGTTTSTITITLKDDANNPVVGVIPTFSATGTANTYGACSVTDASGISTCTLTSTTEETKTLSITSPVNISGGTVEFIYDPVLLTGNLGGSDAAPGEFPWTVAIYVNDRYRCVGALLTSASLLTSAHCIDGVAPSSIKVIAGLHQRSDLTGTEVRSGTDILSVTQHPGFNAPTANANDLAIIRFNPIVIGGNIQLATLPADNTNDYAGLTGVCNSWGRTSASTILPDTLQKANISIITDAEADGRLAGTTAAYGTPAFDNASGTQLAVFDVAESSSCGTTSIMNAPDGVTRVVGIGSYEVMIGGNSSASYPTVSTRVSAYLAWILGNM